MEECFTIRIPPVWQEDIDLWFLQIECQFKLANVTSEELKYAYIVSNLDEENVKTVSDIIMADKEISNKYTNLKNAMMKRIGPSPDERRIKLFSGLQLGDKHPSSLLNKMIRLSAGLNIGDETIKFLWLRQLPRNVKAILTVKEGTLWELANFANSEIYRSDNKVHVSKPAMINKLGTSPDARMEKLFFGLKIGDKNPSGLLHEMDTLSEGLDIHDDTIKFLWLRQLPPNVQMIILTVNEGTLQELAAKADRVFDVYYRSDDKASHLNPTSNSSIAKIENNEKPYRNFNGNFKQHNSNQHFSRFNNCNVNRGMSNNNLCYYHLNYGNSARRCTSPCSFNTKM